MRLIPYDAFVLDLPAVPEVLEARLAARTTPETWLSKFTGGSPLGSSAERFLFAGEVSQLGFRVRRIISYRNPFRPRLCGQFLPIVDGTRVEVSMCFPEKRGVLASMGLVWIFAIIGAIHVLLNGISAWPFVVMPSAMVLFYWVMIQGSFWFDAPTSRREITRILSGS
jgi:hypothetical protein